MKVILLSDMKKVGIKHAVVEVANGYAQNVLLPQKRAIPATPENLKRFEKEMLRSKDANAFNTALLEKNIAELEGKTVHLSARANDLGGLFQTIRAKHIAEVIEVEHGITVPESSIQADDIKKAGEYPVRLSAGKQNATLTVHVGN